MSYMESVDNNESEALHLNNFVRGAIQLLGTLARLHKINCKLLRIPTYASHVQFSL